MEETPVLVNPTPEKAVLATKTDEMLRKLPTVLVGGSISAVVGAGLWGVIAYVTHLQHGVMAVGIGVLVGTVLLKIVGTGSKRLGAIAALFTFSGTLLGNILGNAILAAYMYNQPLVAYLAKEAVGFFIFTLGRIFNFSDIIFYGLAMYIAFHIAKRS